MSRRQKRRAPRARSTASDLHRAIEALLAAGTIFALDDGTEIRYFPAEAFRTVFATRRGAKRIWAAPALLARHPDLVRFVDAGDSA